MILPENYEKIYRCINDCGATAKIYANLDYSKAYKIYRRKFKYDEEKFKEFLSFYNSNCISPIDTVSIENQPNSYVGYEMIFDNGIALPKIIDENLTNLITASLEVPKTLKEISEHHFCITDPNAENITFSTNFKFVDAYSFLLAKKISKDVIFQRNMIKINNIILYGLLDDAYKEKILTYLTKINSKYLETYINLIQTKYQVPYYIHDILSIIQETTQVDKLKEAKSKILTKS